MDPAKPEEKGLAVAGAGTERLLRSLDTRNKRDREERERRSQDMERDNALRHLRKEKAMSNCCGENAKKQGAASTPAPVERTWPRSPTARRAS